MLFTHVTKDVIKWPQVSLTSGFLRGEDEGRISPIAFKLASDCRSVD